MRSESKKRSRVAAAQVTRAFLVKSVCPEEHAYSVVRVIRFFFFAISLLVKD